VPDDKSRLEKLSSSAFNPNLVAYIETNVDLPATCTGSAEITSQIPNGVKLSLQMETPGLVVLADLWDKGWRAYLNGKRVPILRANQAIRGVMVPAGAGTLEFKYEPAGFAWGLRLAGISILVLIGWGTRVRFSRVPKKASGIAHSPSQPGGVFPQ
jgi:uncharacterized membrane protein YfhO